MSLQEMTIAFQWVPCQVNPGNYNIKFFVKFGPVFALLIVNSIVILVQFWRHSKTENWKHVPGTEEVCFNNAYNIKTKVLR